jgi:hypothetical protein
VAPQSKQRRGIAKEMKGMNREAEERHHKGDRKEARDTDERHYKEDKGET